MIIVFRALRVRVRVRVGVRVRVRVRSGATITAELRRYPQRGKPGNQRTGHLNRKVLRLKTSVLGLDGAPGRAASRARAAAVS